MLNAPHKEAGGTATISGRAPMGDSLGGSGAKLDADNIHDEASLENSLLGALVDLVYIPSNISS
jgi:hypothetical protein